MKNRQPSPLGGTPVDFIPLEQLPKNMDTPVPRNWCDAREVYTNTLIDALQPVVYNTIASIYQDAQQIVGRKPTTHSLFGGGRAVSDRRQQSADPTDVENTFVDFLREVSVWNQSIVQGETDNILRSCPWFHNLLKGVFVSNTMVLASSLVTDKPQPQSGINVRATVPMPTDFVRTLYATVAEQFFCYPHLFNENLPQNQVYENRLQALAVIKDAIEKTIRKIIPIQNIIDESMPFAGNEIVITDMARGKPMMPQVAPPQQSVDADTRQSMSSRIAPLPRLMRKSRERNVSYERRQPHHIANRGDRERRFKRHSRPQYLERRRRPSNFPNRRRRRRERPATPPQYVERRRPIRRERPREDDDYDTYEDEERLSRLMGELAVRPSHRPSFEEYEEDDEEVEEEDEEEEEEDILSVDVTGEWYAEADEYEE